MSIAGPQKRVRTAHVQTEMNGEQTNGEGVLEKMHLPSSLRFLMSSLLDVVIPFSFAVRIAFWQLLIFSLGSPDVLI